MGKNSTVLIQEFMLLYKLDSNKIKTWQWTVFKSKYVNTSKDNACGIQHFWNKNENYYLNNKYEGKSVKCISGFFLCMEVVPCMISLKHAFQNQSESWYSVVVICQNLCQQEILTRCYWGGNHRRDCDNWTGGLQRGSEKGKKW